MDDMLAFVLHVLESLPDFLMTAPVSYIVGMCLCLFAAKTLKILIS